MSESCEEIGLELSNGVTVAFDSKNTHLTLDDGEWGTYISILEKEDLIKLRDFLVRNLKD